MEEEKKDEGVVDPFKILLKEALERQRNTMIDNFAQILRRMPTSDTSSSGSHSGGITPFKLQVNFDIPIFEVQIDEIVVDRWLNILEGYFLVHDFSNRERITFSLLKVAPKIKDWQETYYDQKDEREPSLFSVASTWNSFQDAIKEKYYPVGSYEDKYIKCTIVWHERDQDVSEFTNIFHTLHMKLGIKDSEWYLVLKYHCCLHKYIQDEMELLDISSLGATYWYAVKINKKLKQKKQDFGFVNLKQGKGTPKLQKKVQSQGDVTQENPLKMQAKNNTAKTKKDTGKWCEFHKSPTQNTSECQAKQSLMSELKAS